MNNPIPDGNTAALRQYMADQDRAEREAPTDKERDSFIADWMERKAEKIGSEFVIEALVESSIEQKTKLFEGYRKNSQAAGEALVQIVKAYWTPLAEEDANEHDFSEDRKPCRCRGYCTC